MHIVVSAEGSLLLDQPSEFTAFDIQAADPSQNAVLEALADEGSASEESDHVFVSVAALRRLAGAEVDAEWEAGFAKMLEFAGSKGWMNEAGDAVKAHIEQG